jgi:hypothetical protein
MGFHAATLSPFPFRVVIDKSIAPLAKPMATRPKGVTGMIVPVFGS